MNFDQMKKEYNARYNNEMYANSEEHVDMLGMFEKAEGLSYAAKAEFVKAFDFDFALDGELYLGGKRTAAASYTNLLTEAADTGLQIIVR